ncbi:NUDIX hydrolase [Vagococcus elongatus]|uniref:ADP-ribose pyrophosphatase n=1 Tax=Vagococcus elongatus TaxID=180344 RepID=A0A430AYK5_9ENTE|nr:NUDIX hydrolase [Vagococcus elongatus]RSU13124.1 ADP-ribose pyrophosphatase [Vagococcus elongatus]
MMEEKDFVETTVSRENVFNGKIISVAVDQVVLADGTQAERELVFHPGGVGIIAITEDEKLILVKQFRKPFERTMLEIPAGKIERDEKDPRKTAIRELEEETGLGCSSMEAIYDFSLSPGFANEILYLYQAKGLYPVARPADQDEDERIELQFVTLAEAKELIKSKAIFDSKTIMAIQYWELEQLRKK